MKTPKDPKKTSLKGMEIEISRIQRNHEEDTIQSTVLPPHRTIVTSGNPIIFGEPRRLGEKEKG
jgi:hypothetical protein